MDDNSESDEGDPLNTYLTLLYLAYLHSYLGCRCAFLRYKKIIR
ncbi:MAG: hypothetical protein RR385_00475 [Clostridiales bacterium]